jgi:hypothetical protein
LHEKSAESRKTAGWPERLSSTASRPAPEGRLAPRDDLGRLAAQPEYASSVFAAGQFDLIYDI